MFDRRGYLLDITDRVPNRRTFEELVDVLAGASYNEFFVLCRASADTEDDPTAADAFAALKPRLAAYCEMQGIELSVLSAAEDERMLLEGKTVYVSTEAPCSLAGRVEQMRERMEAAEASARQRKAQRFLVTDYADGFAWHPLIVSLPGIILGGNFAYSGARSAKMDLERALNRVLGAPIGGLLLKLGTLYLRGGALRSDASEYFNILANDNGYSRHPGLTQFVLDDVSGIVRGVRVAAERWLDRSDWAAEIVYAANLLDAACHRRDERRLKDLREEHGLIWRNRYLPVGRGESLAKLPRF